MSIVDKWDEDKSVLFYEGFGITRDSFGEVTLVHTDLEDFWHINIDDFIEAVELLPSVLEIVDLHVEKDNTAFEKSLLESQIKELQNKLNSL